MIVPFPGALTAQLNQVGGKGQSLIRMTQLGLPVPPGFVLTVEFFQDWLDTLKLTDEWKAFVSSDVKDLKSRCDALKTRARQFIFSPSQAEAVQEFLKVFESNTLFAVRSSSPAEDLEGSSFAGGYETVLGVKRSEILEAVLVAFSSSLDFRVLAYKGQHGFDIHDPSIAVVVQQQINSTASGVAFSINPLNNDYDEAVFNANFGLGESVVSGVCTPDTIIIDKVTMRIKERVLGAKEERIMLNAEGGTTTLQDDAASHDFAISDGHVLSLTRYIKTLEEVYQKPVDVEWALDGDHEYILQARPVTSFVPLPPSVITPPGEKRKLYWDVTLAVQALEKPMSVMGTSVLRRLLTDWPKEVIGIEFVKADVNHSIVCPTDGRLYAVLSHLMHIFGQETVHNLLTIMDPLSAQALDEVEPNYYADHQIWPNFIALKAAPKILTRMPPVLYCRTFPEKAHLRTQKELASYREEIKQLAKSPGTINQVAHLLMGRGIKVVADFIMPGLAASRLSLERIKRTAAGVDEKYLKNLELAMPYNVTIEMGLALYDLAQQLPPDSGSRTNDIQDQTLSPEFMERWQDFLSKYGHRGPRELDIEAPRNRDTATLLFDQVGTLQAGADGKNNPLMRYENNRKLRDEACQEICKFLEKKDDRKLSRFKFLYRCWETFGGYRETPKYCLIYAIDALRTRILQEAEILVKEGRLENVHQVFDLSLEDFEKKVPKKKIDLVALGQDNRKNSDKLGRVPQLPPLIDSRGRILRPTRVNSDEEGTVTGTPISAGVARGPIKTLHTADEKPLNYGDILVARATDPGWTPLFVNAAAVILEVGGLLQHGALVAREYGLPCVGGVTGATKLWEDGTIVEVDGTRGVIRVVDEESALISPTATNRTTT
ncbi:MAG: PEP/pyruvate-binding domain-containing protein [Candidatus Melainabacteria bacterium]|nr:PEP/pyruvate-binding domain-containing protein [Candidatus Melainabacteria bacterium]